MCYFCEKHYKPITVQLVGYLGFWDGASSKESPASAGDMRDVGSIPGSGRSPGGGHGNPLRYSFLENPMDRGLWQNTVHGVTKSWTRLMRLSTPQSWVPRLTLLDLQTNWTYRCTLRGKLILYVGDLDNLGGARRAWGGTFHISSTEMLVSCTENVLNLTSSFFFFFSLMKKLNPCYHFQDKDLCPEAS